MQPEPPVVTIIDPHNPAPVVDVLAGGGEPGWRPPRWLVLAVTGVMALVGLVGGVVWHLRSEAAKDKAALNALSLSLGFPDVMGGEPQPTLVNNGPDAVRVVSLTLPGYGVVRLNQKLARDQSTTVTLPKPTCSTSLLTTDPTDVPMRLVTARGTHVTRTATTDDDGLQNLIDQTRWRCGLLTPSEAVNSGPAWGVVVRGREATFSLILTNAGRLPLHIISAGADGMEVTVSPHLPVALPPARGTWPSGFGISRDRQTTGATVTVHVRVTDCKALAPIAVDGTGDVLDSQYLHLLLQGPYGSDDWAPDFTTVATDATSPMDPFAELQRACGYTPPPVPRAMSFS